MVRTAMVGVLVLMVASAAAAESRLLVPDLTGLTREHALLAIRAASLAPGRDFSRPLQEGERPGTVVGQAPRPGSRVRRGTVVTLTVALDPAEAGLRPIVPDLRGLLLREARERLAERGLGWRVTDTASSSRERAGRVVSSAPPFGAELSPGTEVALVLGHGPERR